MEKNSFLEILAERFGQLASVRTVFGEPVTTQHKTIIPVVKIVMGLGGGYGTKPDKQGAPGRSSTAESDGENKGEGAGGGGGMYATPKGVYEITDKCTRFIPANATRQFFVLAALAFVMGRWMGTRKYRRARLKRCHA